MSITIINSKYKIKICDNVIRILNSYKQLDSSDCEAGGMLIGYITLDNNVIIEYATEPHQRDIRSRFSYIRRDKTHNEILQKLWRSHTQHIYTYLGEWHSHPEKYPHYSTQDRLNWVNIGEKTIPKKEMFINIIVGTEEFSIWEYRPNNKSIIRREIKEAECENN